jgi:UDP-3-O-acyl-N-acetylglucosamine deacetylase
VRTDLRQRPVLSAQVEQVSGTQRRTILGRPPCEVGLVEHVLAALSGLRIDNCVVELDAPEPPGLDGSAQAFVEALLRAGLVLQSAHKAIWRVDHSVVLRTGRGSLALHPSDDDRLTLSYFLDYGIHSPIARQVYTGGLTPTEFAEEVACCRTFLLEEEAHELRRQGLGSQTTPADLLIFGPRGPIENTLRFGNEPARHKVLDLIGDLSLLGVDLVGHLVACRTGHPHNIELVRLLLQEMRAAVGKGERLAA